MKYSVRLFFSVLLLLTLTFSIGGTLLLYASFSAAKQRDEENALASFRLVQVTAAAVGLNEKEIQLTRVENAMRQVRLAGDAALRLSVDGSTRYCSESTEALFRPTEQSPAEDALIVQHFTDAGRHYMQITGAMALSNLSVVLDGVFSVEDAYALLREQQKIYRGAFCMTILLGAVFTLLLTRLLTRPIKALSRASRRIARGDLNTRADESGDEEFAALAADFNYMTDELEAKIDALTDAMRRQEEFTGAFAHEMKTPMTSIIGYAELLRSHELDEEQRRTAANYIYTESRRVEKLSVKLLDLLVLRRRDFPLADCEISALVESTLYGVAPYMRECRIVLKGNTEQGVRRAEPDLLRTLLLNLLDNARKAMPDGGEIRVRQGITENGFWIAVTDNGCGMPEEELQRITEAFYRVDKSRSRAQGGVGLGLAICDEIAQLHGGTLRFESVLGKGTRVTLTVGGEAE